MPPELKTVEISNAAKTLRARILNYGARIVSLRYYDSGEHETVLHYSSPEQYVDDRYYLGACIGRFPGKIPESWYRLPSGSREAVSSNAGVHSLHGGFHGFSKIFWEISDLRSDSVSFSLLSPDGTEGYPGRLHATVTYQVQDNNTLSVFYEATTDKETLFGMTNHSYFDLSGGKRKDLYGCYLSLASDQYYQNNKEDIPSLISDCASDGMDFRKGKELGQAVDALLSSGGKAIDHCFLTDPDPSLPCAEFRDEQEGIGLSIRSDQISHVCRSIHRTILSGPGMDRSCGRSILPSVWNRKANLLQRLESLPQAAFLCRAKHIMH